MIQEFGAAPVKAVEVSQGPLWLAAAPGNLMRAQGRFLAVEGYLPDIAGLEEPNPAEPWDGHHCLAYADAENQKLVLLRDLSGGEHLFYSRRGGLLLFSNSLRPLLAHRDCPRRLNTDVLAEYLFNGAVTWGDETLFEGIRELPPGHGITISRGEWRAHAPPSPYLEEPRRSPEATPARLRRLLFDATAKAIGDDTQAAVSLSGGIDSATIAALAAEVLGPRNVTAFIYEFAEPGHPSETDLSVLTARRLGIRHHLVRISIEDHLEALPEACRHAENGRVNWNPSRLFFLKRVAREGFTKLLTGDGIELVLGLLSFGPFLRDFARAIPWTPFLDAALTARLPPLLKYVLPARMAGPIPREILGPVFRVLRHNGLIKDMRRFYPAPLSSLLRRFEDSPRVSEALRAHSALPLSAQLMQACFYSFVMPRMLANKAALARGAGVSLVAPALFQGCASMSAAFAHETRGCFRHVHIEAMAGVLPEEVLHRPKIVGQGVSPVSWSGKIIQRVESLTGGMAGLKPLFSPAEFEAARANFAYPLAESAMMSLLFLEEPLRPEASGRARRAAP